MNRLGGRRMRDSPNNPVVGPLALRTKLDDEVSLSWGNT